VITTKGKSYRMCKRPRRRALVMSRWDNRLHARRIASPTRRALAGLRPAHGVTNE
jgi:hypothetical protein